jgi:hypothetical protein
MIENINKIGKYIYKYIIYDNKTRTIDLKKLKNLDGDDNNNILSDYEIKIKNNYIVKKFLGLDSIQQFFSRFMKNNNHKISSDRLSNILVIEIVKYIKTKIKNTLK